METKNSSSLIDKSNNILLIIPPRATDDVISSAFATYRFIKKKGKKVSLLLTEDLPERLSFLKTPKNTINSLSGLRDFVLIFNTKKNSITNLESKQENDSFVIRITPEKGSIDPRDFSFAPSDFQHDLLIILGSPSLESLGKIYHSNTDLFFEIPKINIDNKSSNENFGQVNLVDLTASSVAEICSDLLIKHDEQNIDQEISQALLTGIIAETESFQKATTTPKAMTTAAQLMKYKADQATVIQHLFKTKSFSFLKLWGRIMARLNWDKKRRTAWSLISAEDFVQSRATEDDIPYVLEEIQKNFLEGRIFAIFYSKKPQSVTAQILVTDNRAGQELAQMYDTTFEGKTLKIESEGKDLVETEKDFIEKIGFMEQASN